MLTRQQRLLFLTPLALFLIPFLVWPALLGLFASFTNYVPFQRIKVQLVGLGNYISILHDGDFQASIRNIVVFVIVTVAVELSLGLTIAYALRRPFCGRSFVCLILLSRLPWRQFRFGRLRLTHHRNGLLSRRLINIWKSALRNHNSLPNC